MSAEHRKLHVPELSELAGVLSSALAKNYAYSSVTVTDCPDLRKPPFHLAAQGICGSTRLAEVGSTANLLPTVDRTKKFNLEAIKKQCGMLDAFIIGAGAGPWQNVGTNCEMVMNAAFEDTKKVENRTIKIDKTSGCCCLGMDKSGAFALMANLLLSEGKPGKVLHVKAKQRTGTTNLISCLRKALTNHYGEKAVGIGGTFMIRKGSARLHIMPDFSETPLKTDAEIDNWLRFFEFAAPLVCCSVFVSSDPHGLDLRLEHTHCFSNHGQGGHYHTDTTPEEIEYEGYFVPGESIYRFDQPSKDKITKLGRFDD